MSIKVSSDLHTPPPAYTRSNDSFKNKEDIIYSAQTPYITLTSLMSFFSLENSKTENLSPAPSDICCQDPSHKGSIFPPDTCSEDH